MDSLLTIGVSNAAAVAVLSVVLIPLARWLRRPALTHAVCVLLLLKLVTPPVFTLPLHWLPSGPAAGVETGVAAAVATHQDPLPAPPESPAIASEGDPSDLVDEVPIDDGEALAPLPPAPVAPAPVPIRIAPRPPASFAWARAIAIAWLTAALLCAAMIAFRLRQLRRFLRSAVIAPDDVQAHARVLATRLGLYRPPPVLFVPGRPCPMLLAVFTAPRLLVPRQLWDRLGPQQRQTLLLHELAHLRRRDHWVRCLELLVTVLYWWHPSAWWARVTLREAEEQCCDAWVVWAMPGAVRTYMATLLDAVDFLCEPDAPPIAGRPSRSPRPVAPATPMLASGMGQFHCLERRLTMVKYQAVRRCLSRRGFAAVVGVAALLPLTPTLAQQQEPPATPPAPSVAPVPVAPVQILPHPVVAPANAADDQDSPRNDRADAKPVPASADRVSSSSSSSESSSGSRDDEVARLRRELAEMRSQLRAYEEQLRAARDAERAARDAERSAREGREGREGRETRTAPRAPVPVPPTPAAPGQNRIGAITVPATPGTPNAENTRSITVVPGGEVRTVTRDGVTYRELVTSQPGQPDLKGRVIVRSGDNEVQGLDRETGKVLWIFRMAPDAKVNAVDVAGGVARIRLSDGKTLQLDLPTGRAVDGAGSNNLYRAVPPRADNNQEKRLKALEDKLDRLMKEVERMNQNRGGDRDRGDDRESRPGTSQGPARS